MIRPGSARADHRSGRLRRARGSGKPQIPGFRRPGWDGGGVRFGPLRTGESIMGQLVESRDPPPGARKPPIGPDSEIRVTKLTGQSNGAIGASAPAPAFRAISIRGAWKLAGFLFIAGTLS